MNQEQEACQPSVPSPRGARRVRLRWWRVLLAVVLLAGLIGGYYRPRPLRLVGRYRAGGDWMVWIRPNGFGSVADHDPVDPYLPPSSCTFVLRDWDGRLRWKVQLPKPNLRGWHVNTPSLWNGRALSFSPDGRVLAAATADGGYLRVNTWRDGRLLAQQVLPVSPAGPITGRMECDIRALSSGRVLLYHPYQPNTVLLALAEGNVVARGQFTTSLPLKRSEYYYCLLSRDGTTITGCGDASLSITGTRPCFEYATLAVSGARIKLTNRYRNAVVEDDDHVLFANGLLVTTDGAVYGPHGRVSPKNGWEICSYDYAVDTLAQRNGENVRVLHLPTGATWRLPRTYELETASVAYQGRYAALVDTPRPLPDLLRRLLERRPRTRQYLQQAEMRRRIRLYARSGRLCAQWPLTFDPRIGCCYTYQGERLEFDDLCLSPDGKRMLLMVRSEKRTYKEYFLYRW